MPKFEACTRKRKRLVIIRLLGSGSAQGAQGPPQGAKMVRLMELQKILKNDTK